MSLLPVLAVDLDHTLIRTDLQAEQLIRLIKTRPWKLPSVLLAALQSRPAAKAAFLEHVNLPVEYLPYRQEVITLIKKKRAEGWTTVLATASHQVLADRISKHLGVFDFAMGSNTNAPNFKGEEKVRQLRSRFGNRPLWYAGDSHADLKIWPQCEGIVAVAPPPLVASAIRRLNRPAEWIQDADQRSLLKLLIKEARPHHWVKNFLIFIPLLAAHRFLDDDAWIKTGIAFLTFSFLSSSVYVLNDLFDLESDRQHRTKRNRPLASGALGIGSGLTLWIALMAVSAGMAFTLPVTFQLVLLGYWVSNLVYSLWAKRELMLDVVTLGGLFTLRILAGGTATAIPISQWLLSFSLFVFFGLALMKRQIELQGKSDLGSVSGRGYLTSDQAVVLSFGVASSCAAPLIFILYLNSPEVQALYTHPFRLWALVPIMLFWLSRTWALAVRGSVNDDPIVYALKDRTTWICLVIGAVLVACAL